MWRQFTQWLGGMGIIVLALAVLPRLRVGGRQLLESEMPGPEIDQPRRADPGHGAAAVAALRRPDGAAGAPPRLLGWLGVDDRMTPYEAVAHAFATMPTGGFAMEARSVEAYRAAAQWIIVVFMVIAGANFALTYRAVIRRRPRVLVRDEELRLYCPARRLRTARGAVGKASRRASAPSATPCSRPSR